MGEDEKKRRQEKRTEQGGEDFLAFYIHFSSSLQNLNLIKSSAKLVLSL